MVVRGPFLSDENVPVAGTAVGLTTPGTNDAAIIQVQTASIRFNVDGGAPTASVGTLAFVNDIIELHTADELAKFRAIRAGATSANLRVNYARGGR
jgi:hypothetical protein